MNKHPIPELSIIMAYSPELGLVDMLTNKRINKQL